MAANDRVLADEDGDYPDWLELRNLSAAEVDLAGWSLTDDPNNLSKWQFPSTRLPSGGYLVVFASGKNRRSGGTAPLHTSFKLEASGEYLALLEPDGTVATAYAHFLWAGPGFAADELGVAPDHRASVCAHGRRVGHQLAFT
jgi:hypothetical protein